MSRGVTIRKEEILELLRRQPDEIDVEELIYQLYLREKVAAGEADITAGRVLSAEEMRKQASEWQK